MTEGATSPEERPGTPNARRQQDPSGLLNLFASSRFFVGLAIIGAFVAGVVVHVYATLLVLQLSWRALTSGERSIEGLETLSLAFVELIDVFLLGIVFYLIAVGFYQLFINAELPVPHWLRIDDLDELKVKLIAVIIVMLGVNFLGVIELDNQGSVLDVGIAVALVVVAFAVVLWVYERRRDDA